MTEPDDRSADSPPPGQQPGQRYPHAGWDQPPLAEVPSGDGDWQWTPPGQAADLPHGQYPGYLLPGYPAPTRPRRLRWVLSAAAAVLVLVLGGGAFAAYEVLNGGGEQPDQVVPASAVAFTKLDLNPSAGQKIAAARFLHRLPKVGSGFTGSRDWRESIFQALDGDGSLPAGVQYDRDVKPWLGKRLGVAALPTLRDGKPEVLLALQSTDDAKARVGIRRFNAEAGIGFLHGYAVVAETQQLADQAVADAKAASLAGSDTYRSDMRTLGGLGVASGWLDLGQLSKLAKQAGQDHLASGFGGLDTGRLAATVRLGGTSADLIGKLLGARPSGSTAAPSLADLPGSTAVAMSASIPPGTLDAYWNRISTAVGGFLVPNPAGDPSGSFSDPIQSLQDQFGITLPRDLDTLLGHGVSVAVDSNGIDRGMPHIAVRTVTDGKAAVRVLDKVRDAVQQYGTDLPFSYREVPGGLLAGNDKGYLDQVAGAGGGLGGQGAFTKALPDLAGASMVGYVNFDAISGELAKGGGRADQRAALSSFQAAGMTVRLENGITTLHVRLLAH